MWRCAMPAEVLVRVVDADTGRPLPWVAVMLDTRQAITDSTGTARLVVPPGRYTLKVRSLAYRPHTRAITAREGLNRLTVRLARALL